MGDIISCGEFNRLLPNWCISYSDTRLTLPHGSLRVIGSNGDFLLIWEVLDIPKTYFVCFEGIANVLISFVTQTISVDVVFTPHSDATLHHLLVDQILPRVLAENGAFVLHASAIQVDDSAALFVGDTGRGKSTLCASFDQEGFSLLTDDVVTISLDGHKPMATAFAPTLRMNPDSIASIFKTPPPASQMAEYSRKMRVHLPASDHSKSVTLPIGSVFFLRSPEIARNVTVSEVGSAEFCMGLIENSFAFNPANRPEGQNKLFLAGKVANRVQGFTLAYRREYSDLPMVRHAVLNSATQRLRPDVR